MVNKQTYKPYDPNDDSERSSGGSYVPTRREIEEKREQLEEQRIINESIDTSQDFVKPIQQEQILSDIRKQEEKVRTQEQETQLQADYLRTFAQENASAIDSYKIEMDRKYDEVQKWIDGFTPQEYGKSQGEYQQNIDGKIKEFTDLQTKYNESIEEYNKSYDTFKTELGIKIDQLQATDLELRKDVAQYNFNLPKVPDSPAFDYTGTDTGSNTTKKPDFDIQPDFSRTGEDIGNNPGISKIQLAPDFSKVGEDKGERTDKDVFKKIFEENPDKEQSERFVESLGDIDKGTFQRLAPRYPDKYSPDQELILQRKWEDLAKGSTPDTTTLTSQVRAIAKDSSPDLPLQKEKPTVIEKLDQRRKSFISNETLRLLSLSGLGTNPSKEDIQYARKVVDDWKNQREDQKDAIRKSTSWVWNSVIVEPGKATIDAIGDITTYQSNQLKQNPYKILENGINPIAWGIDPFSPKDKNILQGLWSGVPLEQQKEIPFGEMIYDTPEERKKIIQQIKDSIKRLKGESGYLTTAKNDFKNKIQFNNAQNKLDELTLENQRQNFQNRYMKIDDPLARAYESLSQKEKSILDKGGSTAWGNFLRQIAKEGGRQTWNITSPGFTVLFFAGVGKTGIKAVAKAVQPVVKVGKKGVVKIATKDVISQSTFLDHKTGEIFNVKKLDVQSAKVPVYAIERELKTPLKRTLKDLPNFLTAPAKKKILELQQSFERSRAYKKFSYDQYFIADATKGIRSINERIKLDKAQESFASTISASDENLRNIGKKIEEYKNKFSKKRPELKNEINNLQQVSKEVFNEYSEILSKQKVNNLAKEYTAKQLFQLADKSPQRYTSKQFQSVLDDLDISLGTSQTKQTLKKINKKLSQSDIEFAKYVNGLLDSLRRNTRNDLERYFVRNAKETKKLKDGLENGKWKKFDDKEIRRHLNNEVIQESYFYDYLTRPTAKEPYPFGKLRKDWGDQYYKSIVDGVPIDDNAKKLFLNSLKSDIQKRKYSSWYGEGGKQQFITATGKTEDVLKSFGGKTAKEYDEFVRSRLSKNQIKKVDDIADNYTVGRFTPIKTISKRSKAPKNAFMSIESDFINEEQISNLKKGKISNLEIQKRMVGSTLQPKTKELPKSKIKTFSFNELKVPIQTPIVPEITPRTDVPKPKPTSTNKNTKRLKRFGVNIPNEFKPGNKNDVSTKTGKQPGKTMDKTKVIIETPLKSNDPSRSKPIPKPKPTPSKTKEKIKVKTKIPGIAKKKSYTKDKESIGKKGVIIPRLSKSKIKSLKIDKGKNPSKVGWKQGKFYPLVDLNRSTIEFKKNKPDGLKEGKKPIDSFTVLQTSNLKPKKQQFDFGKFQAKINGEVSFKLKRKRILGKQKLVKKNNFRKV